MAPVGFFELKRLMNSQKGIERILMKNGMIPIIITYI
jgi:hypothetical protein